MNTERERIPLSTEWRGEELPPLLPPGMMLSLHFLFFQAVFQTFKNYFDFYFTLKNFYCFTNIPNADHQVKVIHPEISLNVAVAKVPCTTILWLKKYLICCAWFFLFWNSCPVLSRWKFQVVQVAEGLPLSLPVVARSQLFLHYQRRVVFKYIHNSAAGSYVFLSQPLVHMHPGVSCHLVASPWVVKISQGQYF